MRALVIRLSALGDIIHTWPLVEHIRHHRADVHIAWTVEAGFRSMVEGHPAVDEVLAVRTRSWRRRPFSRQVRGEFSDFRKGLRRVGADIAIDPQGLVKSALVAGLSGAPRRIGLARPWRRELLAGLAYTETIAGAPGPRHVVATNLELARSLGIDPPDLTPAPDGRWLLTSDTGMDLARAAAPAYAVILPGAGAASKVLPVATLGATAARLAAEGLAVVVAWGPGEEPRARHIARAAGSPVEIAPPTDLRQLAVLLARSAVVVGADTGPVHLAASLGVPTVGFFLTTDWRRNGPLGDRVAVVSAASTSSTPTSRARTRPVRQITASELTAAALRLLS